MYCVLKLLINPCKEMFNDLCIKQIYGSFAETLLENRSRRCTSSTRRSSITKYSQYIICMDLMKFPGHWCNVHISCPFFLCKHVKWVIWANRPFARKSKKNVITWIMTVMSLLSHHVKYWGKQRNHHTSCLKDAGAHIVPYILFKSTQWDTRELAR